MSRLARDNSDLPKARQRQESAGWGPDLSPRFGPLLVNQWFEEEHDVPMASASARFRYSNAGACSRLIAYAALKLPPSNPPDPPGRFIMRQGDILHDAIQKAIQAAHPGAEIEVKSTIGDDMAGHADVEVVVSPGDQPTLVSIEIKSMGGFAYKQAVGDRFAPKGPKYQHVIQGALNAKARNADELVILYLARDAIAIGPAKARDLPEMARVTAEWTLPRERFEPEADKEIERISAILGLVDAGLLPRRKIPDPELPVHHLITDPRDGTYIEDDGSGNIVNVDSYWACEYCRYQRLCIDTPAERVKIEEVPVVIEAMKERA